MRRLACCLLIAACGGNPAPEKTAPTSAAAPPAAPPTVRPVVQPVATRDVNGTRLAYRLSGDSTAVPLVFVHGSLADLRAWYAQEVPFAQYYRVLVYSRRYHRPNLQTNDDQSYSPKLHAEDLAALLLTLELPSANVVGSGYGGYVALTLAREHPDMVRTLVLVEPPIVSLLTGSETGDPVRRAFFTSALDPARAAFARGDSVAGARAYYDAMNGRGRFDALSAGARGELLGNAFELRREMQANREEYFPPISCAELSRFTKPVLIVRGERSPPLFQQVSNELARCLQSDTTVVIPGAGHPPNTANAAYFNQVVARYLATH